MRPDGDRIATSYFGTGSGINRAIRTLGERGPIRIGILGLGAGVTATLARAGDTLHYYEINPLVVRDRAIASSDSGGPVRPKSACSWATAGWCWKQMPDEHLDLLAMDAFSSDAVPVHLLTAEAYRDVSAPPESGRRAGDQYHQSLSESGARGGRSGRRQRLDAASWWTTMARTQDYYSPSTWVLLSRDAALFDHKNFQDEFAVSHLERKPGFRAWTDDYSNIIQILQ